MPSRKLLQHANARLGCAQGGRDRAGARQAQEAVQRKPAAAGDAELSAGARSAGAGAGTCMCSGGVLCGRNWGHALVRARGHSGRSCCTSKKWEERGPRRLQQRLWAQGQVRARVCAQGSGVRAQGWAAFFCPGGSTSGRPHTQGRRRHASPRRKPRIRLTRHGPCKILSELRALLPDRGHRAQG